MGAMEEEAAPGSSSTGSAHLNTEYSLLDIPLPPPIISTSVECIATRDSASLVTGNTSFVPVGVPTEQVLTTRDKLIPTTTESFVTTTSISSNITDAVVTYAQATRDSAMGRTTTTITDTTLVTIGTTPSTTGSLLNTPDTAVVNTQTFTPIPSTTPTMFPIFRTSTDIVSPMTDRTLDATPKTTDVVQGTTGTTSTSDTALTMEGVVLTNRDANLTMTSTTPSTTGFLLNTPETAMVNTETVTPIPSTAPGTSHIYSTTTDIVSPLTEKVLDLTPKTADTVPVTRGTTSTSDTALTIKGKVLTTCTTPFTTGSLLNTPGTEKITSIPSTSSATSPIFSTTTDIVSPLTDRALDAMPLTTYVVPAMTDTTANSETDLTMEGIVLTTCTTPSTTGSLPDTAMVNTETITSVPSTAPATSPIFSTTTDIVSPITDRALDATPKTSDIAQGTTSTSDAALTMEGIVLTTCTTPFTTGSLPDTAMVNTETVTPVPSTAPTIFPMYGTTTDVISPLTDRALDATPKTSDSVQGTTSTSDAALTMEGIVLTTSTTPSTTGSLPETLDTETITPIPSTTPATSPIFSTTTDIVSPLTDRALEATPLTTDVVPAMKDTTANTETDLAMEDIVLTTCRTPSTTGSLLNTPDTAVINTETITPLPSTTPATSPIFNTTIDIVSPLTDRALEGTPMTTYIVPAMKDTASNTETDVSMKGIVLTTCTTPSTTSSLLNTLGTERVTSTPTARPTSPIFSTTTDIVSPLTNRALGATPVTTEIVPAMMDATANTETVFTVKGLVQTTTDEVLTVTCTTPASQDIASTTIDTAQTANNISTAKTTVAPAATSATSVTINKSLVVRDVPPSSLSNCSSSKINGVLVKQNEPTRCSLSLQSSSQRKENSSATSALSLLTTYGVSDSEEDSDMDTSCDNDENGDLLVNGTQENVSSHVPPEPQGDIIMKPFCEFSSLNSGQSSHPAAAQQMFSNGVVSDESRCDTPTLDVIVSGSYRHTVDVGSGTDDSEDDSESASSSEYESSSSESETSSSEIVEVEVVSQIQKNVVHKRHRKKRDVPLTPGELLIDDLPPIEDLHISVPQEQARPIGTIYSIVRQQVVVEAFPNIPPIDLDSVLFLDRGKRALGQIFDVFGPVQQPFYVVRFNSAEHVRGHKIDPGDLVCFAPSTEHTNYVVIDDLMKIKGSDACGLSGNELMPYECRDFSDDEEEARVLRGSKQTTYTSTSEFQPQKKRGRGQVYSRGRGRGCSETQGENSDHNPFRGRGMISRGHHHRFAHPTVTQPRFSLRGPPPFPMGPPNCVRGPPNCVQGPPNCVQGPPMRPPSPFIQESPRMPGNPGAYEPRPFSHFQNHVEMACGQDISVIPPEGERYHSGPPPDTGGWPQPPSLQFGGPPQFTIPRGCLPPPGMASPHGIPSHPPPPPPPPTPPPSFLPPPPPPPPSPSGNSFQYGGPPGSFNGMMHSSYSPEPPGIEFVRAGERGWFHQQVAEPHVLPTPERYPHPPPLHTVPPPPPTHNIPPPFPSHNIPPPFPSHNIPPPPVPHNMPTLPTAPHPPPPPFPHHVPFDPSHLPPLLPPASYQL